MTGAALVLSVVDTRTRELHLVPIETAALHRHSGCYPALCGVDVPAASLSTPPTRCCSNCATRNQNSGAGGGHRRPAIRPHRLLVRLCRRG